MSNRLIVFFADTSDARGFRQWKKIGRYPKKGSKALYILSPRHRKKEEEEEEKIILTGFVPMAVFRFEDTAGEPLPQVERRPQHLPPLIEVAQGWGIDVSWQSFQGKAYGFYRPNRNEIVLATHEESVFFHELAHAAHQRINGSLKQVLEERQEIVAELTAAVLVHLYGRRPNDGGSYRYIRSYAEKAGQDVYRACLGVIGEVGRCLDAIVQGEEGTQGGKEEE